MSKFINPLILAHNNIWAQFKRPRTLVRGYVALIILVVSGNKEGILEGVGAPVEEPMLPIGAIFR